MLELGCRVVLVNGFLQMASCAVLAAAVISAAQDRRVQHAVVARLAGNEADEARAAIVGAGGYAESTMSDACRTAVQLTTRAGGRTELR
jgi:succinyl-CoA synthetase beta subunit